MVFGKSYNALVTVYVPTWNFFYLPILYDWFWKFIRDDLGNVYSYYIAAFSAN